MTGRIVDLRSDTVTKPSLAMRRVMAEAEVGDDVYGEDPSVRALEEEAARAVGQEAAMFVPSGTMGNQIAMNVQVRAGDEVILDADSHIADHELGGLASWTGGMPRMIRTTAGAPTLDQLESAYRSGDPDYVARSALIALENTHMVSGGVPHPPGALRPILEFAHAKGLAAHLDGARIFNASTALGVSASALASGFSSVMFCFSKGLGAPIGSCIAGSAPFIVEARRVRKRLGGGMRQVGIVAAAALYALRHNVGRLGEDHARARSLAQGIAETEGFRIDPDPPPTNIVMVSSRGEPAEVCRRLAEHGVLALTEGPKVRLVTHLDVDDEGIAHAIAAFQAIAKPGRRS